jgi:carbonic anhydrase/acetyltransferase-like protein (isoleucine patch superfamily)
MIIEHEGKGPTIDPTARIAPTAVICGDVIIGAGTSIGFGAVLTAESGPVRIGAECVVMENAVLRGVVAAPLVLGNRVMVGPRASLSGCTIENEAFIATGAAVFNGAQIGPGAEVRINGVVHIGTRLPAGAMVPIGWVAVGDPAEILPPDRHEEIWAIQRMLDFPKRVFGLERRPDLIALALPRYAKALGRRHAGDKIIG